VKIGRWVLRAVRSIVAAVITLAAGLAICFVGMVLVVGAIYLAAVVVFTLVFGLVYAITGEEGLAQAHAFLEAYRPR
jgi:hypothetical protein